MTTPDLDEQLRRHYASFRRDHADQRERLLDRLRAEPAPIPEHSTLFSRRWLMRLSAAAVVALATGITVFFITPGPSGLTWAEVAKAIGPVKSVQYRTLIRQPAARGNVGTLNYVTASARRTDTWLNLQVSTAEKLGSDPATSTAITLNEGCENTQYNVEREGAEVRSVVQSVSYVSAVLGPIFATDDEPAGVLRFWRALQDLPPEAVLKRGSEQVDGKRLLRFQVIETSSLPIELTQNLNIENGPERGTFVLVDPQTKRPVQVVHDRLLRWSDIRLNEPIPEEKFAPPAVPDDLDAEVYWSFTLPAMPAKEKSFTFRVLDADGKPIVTEADLAFTRSNLFGGEEVLSPAGAPGMEVSALAPGQPAATASLTESGVAKLDGYMARHLGATITIQIAGEPDLHRKVFGRLHRDPRGGADGGPVRITLIAPPKAETATTAPHRAGPANQ